MNRISNYVHAGDLGANPDYLNELRSMETENVDCPSFVYQAGATTNAPTPAASSSGLARLVARLHGCAKCEEDAVEVELFI